ncbi:MAG TPA: porin [Casimicrobiaceae bacterium]|nr:porin [Casimicrobiaceae bacterium]
MKKGFVVAALLAASLSVHAQTGLVMYGRLNLDLEYIHANGDFPNVTRLSSNSSRLGVRGTESLGGGNYALFQLEASVAADAGGGNPAGRDTFVGLTGAWGTLKFGYFLAPYDDMHPLFGNDPTLTTSILATSSIWANGFAPKGVGGFDDRLPNSIRYDTPNFNGLFGGVQVALAENPPAHGYVLSMAATYINGPFVGGIAYERNKDVRAKGLDDWAFTATAAWDFGFARVAALYERLDYETFTGPLKRNLYGASMTASAANGTFYAVWIHGADGKGGGSRVAGLLSGPDTSADQWEVSYTYAFSKRVVAYAGYVRLDNERNAGYTFNINAYLPRGIVPPLVGMRLNGYVLGLVHYF